MSVRIVKILLDCKNYILTQFSKQDDFLRFNSYFDTYYHFMLF